MWNTGDDVNGLNLYNFGWAGRPLHPILPDWGKVSRTYKAFKSISDKRRLLPLPSSIASLCYALSARTAERKEGNHPDLKVNNRGEVNFQAN